MPILLVIANAVMTSVCRGRPKMEPPVRRPLLIDNLLNLLNSLDTWFACRRRGVGGRMKRGKDEGGRRKDEMKFEI